MYTLPSKADVIMYLHVALRFPTKETLLAATRAGFLTSWPGLTVTAINKHLPESVEMQKGHMNISAKAYDPQKYHNHKQM